MQNKMQVPDLKTRKEIIKERMASGDAPIAIVMSSMFGDLKNIPEYNDNNEILKKAKSDIRSMDFGDMSSYIESLDSLVEHYKELAEHYLDHIDKEKYILDDNGYLDEIDLSYE